jgi:hypothetical protein
MTRLIAFVRAGYLPARDPAAIPARVLAPRTRRLSLLTETG